MKKIIFIIFLILLCAAAVSSCQREPVDISTEDGYSAASNELMNFYFLYPSDWAVNRNETMISIYRNEGELFQTDMESGGEPYTIIGKTNISAIAFRVTSDVTAPEDYWNDFCLPELEILNNFSLTSSEDDVMGSFDAKRYDFTADIGGVEFRFAQVFALDRGVVYTVTYTASPEKFGEYEDVLQKVTSTFALK